MRRRTDRRSPSGVAFGEPAPILCQMHILQLIAPCAEFASRERRATEDLRFVEAAASFAAESPRTDRFRICGAPRGRAAASAAAIAANLLLAFVVTFAPWS